MKRILLLAVMIIGSASYATPEDWEGLQEHIGGWSLQAQGVSQSYYAAVRNLKKPYDRKTANKVLLEDIMNLHQLVEKMGPMKQNFLTWHEKLVQKYMGYCIPLMREEQKQE